MKAALLGTVVLFCRPALASGVLGFSDEEAGKRTGTGVEGARDPRPPRVGWGQWGLTLLVLQLEVWAVLSASLACAGHLSSHMASLWGH